VRRDDDARALGLTAAGDAAGVLAADAPLALACWRGTGTVAVLVAKAECAQLADKVRARPGACVDSHVHLDVAQLVARPGHRVCGCMVWRWHRASSGPTGPPGGMGGCSQSRERSHLAEGHRFRLISDLVRHVTQGTQHCSAAIVALSAWRSAL
jgi:hypothetical protein